MLLFGGELQIDAKNSNFENFETALCMKSESMPLNFVQKYYFSIPLFLSAKLKQICYNQMYF